MSKNFIADTAIVEDTVAIGNDVKIWHYTHIRSHVYLGNKVIIGSNVYIGSGVSIGDNSKIQNNALIYEPAKIGNGVFIGPGVIFTNDHNPRAINSDKTQKDSLDWNKSEVVVGEGASIGAGAICVGSIEIGKWALIGAGSVVIEDVPDYGLVVGNPAKQIGWVGPAGIRLKMVAENIFECPKSKDKFNVVNGTLHKDEV